MCGLFGFIGAKKEPINKFLLCILGVDNDSRGGDSCGLFIDEKVEYGLNNEKYFSNFFKESKLLKKKDKAQIIIGHDRKTSVGKTDLESAQPVIIKNNDGLVDFVLIHNGTISNYKELAEKYLTDYDGYTDSQIMAYIIYYWGYDVLAEYEGTGVFITVDYRQNKYREPVTHIFKGASKQYISSTNITEERPLYLMEENNNYWFSSLDEYLNIYAYIRKLKIIDFPINMLVMISEGKLYKIKEYDRSKKCQRPVTTYNNIKTYPTANVNTNTNQYGMFSGYPWYDDFDYDEPDDKISLVNSISSPQIIESIELPFTLPEDIDCLTNLEIISKINKKIPPEKLTETYINYQDLYYSNGINPLNGVYFLEKDGSKASEDINLSKCYSFVDGVLLYHPKILYAFLAMSEYLDCYVSDIYSLLEETVYKYSPFPSYSNILSGYVNESGQLIEKEVITPLFQSKNHVTRIAITKGDLTTFEYDYSNYSSFNPMNEPYQKYREGFKKYDKYKLSTLIKEIYGSLSY